MRSLAPARHAIPSAADPSRLLASAWRLFAFSVSGNAGVFIVISAALLAVTGLAFPFIGRHPEVVLWAILLVLGRLLSVPYGGDMHEFLLPRPFRNGPRVLAGVVFPLLLVLIVPATGLCFTSRLDRGGGLIPTIVGKRAPSADDIRYMHGILGATFLPAVARQAVAPPVKHNFAAALLDVHGDHRSSSRCCSGWRRPEAGEKARLSTTVATVVANLRIIALRSHRVLHSDVRGMAVPGLWFWLLAAAVALVEGRTVWMRRRAAGGDARRLHERATRGGWHSLRRGACSRAGGRAMVMSVVGTISSRDLDQLVRTAVHVSRARWSRWSCASDHRRGCSDRDRRSGGVHVAGRSRWRRAGASFRAALRLPVPS